MLEVHDFPRVRFKTYIVTGGGQDFVGVYCRAGLWHPPEHMVGSVGGTKLAMARWGRSPERAEAAAEQ